MNIVFILPAVYDGVKAAVGNFSYVTVRQFVETILTMAKDNTGLVDNLLLRMLFPNELLYTTDHKRAIPPYFDVRYL